MALQVVSCRAPECKEGRDLHSRSCEPSPPREESNRRRDVGWTPGCSPFYQRMRTMTGMPYGEMEFAAYMRPMIQVVSCRAPECKEGRDLHSRSCEPSPPREESNSFLPAHEDDDWYALWRDGVCGVYAPDGQDRPVVPGYSSALATPHRFADCPAGLAELARCSGPCKVRAR
jgi:hypothetical protein